MWSQVFACCAGPRDPASPTLPPVEESKQLGFVSKASEGSPVSSLVTTPSRFGQDDLPAPGLEEDEPRWVRSSLTVAAALAAAATGFVFATSWLWPAKAAALLTTLLLLVTATRSQQLQRPAAAPEPAFVPGAIAALHTADEAREVRDRTWLELGIPSSEVAQIRELQLALREQPRDPRGRRHRRRRRSLQGSVAETDVVTAWRFLRAHGWNLTAAEEAIKLAHERREALQELDAGLLGCCGQLARHWRGQGFAGVDVDGDLVLWERPGLLDWQGLSNVSEDLLVCCEMLAIQRLAYELDLLAVQEDRPRYRVGVVVDLEGLPMSFARPQNLKLLKRILEMDSALMPETLKWVLLVNPPSKFSAVWEVLLPYFGPETQRKFRIVPPEETQAVLQMHVHREHLPRFLGGSSRQPRLLGAGKIPRRLLRELGACGLPKALRPAPAGGEGATFSMHPAAAAGARELPLPVLAPEHRTALARLGRGLRLTSSFAVKTRDFARSDWPGPGGSLPPPHSWGVLPDAAAFPGRDGRVNGKSILQVLDVDMFRSSEEDPVLQAYGHPELAPQHFRRQGERRFLLVVNFILGHWQHVVTAAVDQSAMSAPDWQLWKHFLAQSESAKGRALRVAATSFEGPIFVQELLREQKATHLGRFLPSFSAGEDFLEVTVHLASSEMRRLRVVFQHSYHLIVNGLAFHLDGPVRSQDRLLFAYYCSFVDVQRVRKV